MRLLPWEGGAEPEAWAASLPLGRCSSGGLIAQLQERGSASSSSALDHCYLGRLVGYPVSVSRDFQAPEMDSRAGEDFVWFCF